MFQELLFHCGNCTDSWLWLYMLVDVVFCTKESMCGQRGLLHNTDVQTFQVSFSRHLRTQYERIQDFKNRVRNVFLIWSAKIETSCVQHDLFACRLQRPGLLESRDSSSANQFEQKTSVYNTMNHFLRSFIDHVTHTDQYDLTTCIRLCLNVNVCGHTCWFVLSRPTVKWNI